MEIDELSKPEFYAATAWGAYYPNRYYFTIDVHKTREMAGLSPIKPDLTAQEQMQLQWENYPAMLHEFLHYLHDLSTLVGQASLFHKVLMQSIFTKYATPGLSSAASLGNKKEPALDQDFHSAFMFSKTVEGDGVLITKMHQIKKITDVSEPITGKRGDVTVTRDIPIPNVEYVEMVSDGEVKATIKFGSFYLFECIAHEVDQLVSKRLNHPAAGGRSRNGTEYTVARMVAQYLYPQIDPLHIPRLALMALQYMDCGATFIQMVNELKDQAARGISQDQAIQQIKKRISAHLEKAERMFEAQLGELIRVFEGRTQLERSFRHLKAVSMDLYRQRIVDPCFELELIYNDQVQQLLKKAQLCDFIYIFEDSDPAPADPKLERDYIGTTMSDMKTSVALKTLVAFDHYFSMHYAMKTEFVERRVKDEYICPFYSCCPFSYRKDHASLCRTKPWRVYELQYAADRQYCWYGSGVLETKGLTVPRTTVSTS